MGQLAKLNENKMANRCAMRQRPNPKREVPSQPTPAGSSGSCSSWHLRLAACGLAVTSLSQCSAVGLRLSRSRASCPSLASVPFLFLTSYPLSLSTLPATHAAMVAHAACTLPYCTALEPSICSTCVAAHIIYGLPSSFYLEYETITRKATEIPRLPGPPKIAGFREEPGARLLLNAPTLLASWPCLTAMAGRPARDALLNSDLGGGGVHLTFTEPTATKLAQCHQFCHPARIPRSNDYISSPV